MMQYQIIPVTEFQENCSIIWCETTMKGAIIDPGGEPELIQKAVGKLGVTIEKILLTHGHLDHVGAAVELSKCYNVEILGPSKEDQFLFDSLPEMCMQFGFPYIKPFLPNKWLDEGEQISIGTIMLDIFYCPGHTPGHIVFIDQEQRIALVGDVLFKGSIGRTDFPKGDYQDLMDSINLKLLPLGDDIVFIPGHGSISSFGSERLTNPFLS